MVNKPSEALESFDFSPITSSAIGKSQGAASHDKLATAVATAVLLARSEIGDGRTVTFDLGSIALVRQLISGDCVIPKRKTLESEAKELVKQLLAAARKHDLKVGKAPGRMPQEQSGALQLALVLQEKIDPPLDNSSAQTLLIPDQTGGRASDAESLDQTVFRHVLKRLVEHENFPTIADVQAVLEDTKRQLEDAMPEHHEDTDPAIEALSTILDNVENAEERVDRFQERFGRFPGVTGVAYAFWGWSQNPLENFEQRIHPLKSLSTSSHQAARIVFAAGVGAGRLRPAYLRSRLWMAGYEAAWQLLLSDKKEHGASDTNKTLWHVKQSSLDLKEAGPFVEGRIGEGLLPMGLQIVDPLLVVQRMLPNCSNRPNSRARLPKRSCQQRTAISPISRRNSREWSRWTSRSSSGRTPAATSRARSSRLGSSRTRISSSFTVGRTRRRLPGNCHKDERSPGSVEDLPGPRLEDLGKRLTDLRKRLSD
ncbi:MAG: hypothetical protein U5L08_07765 [Xanthomonadales bacterium]|nr:hypothetical protein [Xanthomonadales bacterium]